jgi:DNA-binding GntR family transcriptional regulator
MVAARTTRTEQAYRHLMQDVLRGRWEPGDTLSTYALAEELGISRTPVLEALKRLESEGLVEIIPQVGSRIVRPTPEALEELFALRGALEGLAAAAAARRIDDNTLAALEAMLRRLEDAADRGDRAAYENLDQQFHLRVIEASGMSRVDHAAQGVWPPLRYQLANAPLRAEQLRESIPEYRELYEALRRRSSKRARAAAERQVRLSAGRFLAGSAPSPNGLVHRALIYSGDEDFLATVMPFVEEGLSGDERVLVVTTPHNTEVLVRALDDNADEVEFRDSSEWYQLPSHTLLSYERYIEQADRERVRVIGEVAWDGDTRAPLSEWTRYESVLNVVFAREPLSIVCPYDAQNLPDPIVADARRTHPELCSGDGASTSPEFVDAETLMRQLDREGLPEPSVPTAEQSITADLRDVREFILDQAHRAGVSGKTLQDAFLAVQEVAANVIMRGPGQGTIRAWVEDDELIYEVREAGISAGELAVVQLEWDPALLMSEPRGLWMARLLCELVEVRSEDGVLVVRLHVARG